MVDETTEPTRSVVFFYILCSNSNRHEMKTQIQPLAKKYLAQLGLFLLLGLFSSCANSNGLQFIDNYYSAKKEPYTKVIVLPLNEKIKIKNETADSISVSQNEYPTATAREKEVFDNYLKLLIKEKTQSNVTNLEQNISYDQSKLVNHEAVIDDQKIQFCLPDPKDLSNGKEKADYILLFDDVSFSKVYSVDGASLGRVADGSYMLKIGFEYLIWDVKLSKVAGYGKISQKTKLLVVPQKEDFVVVLDKLAEMLVQKSPFVPRKIYF